VSSYGVDDEEIDEAKAAVQDYLKSIKLGKSRYLQPQTYCEGGPSHKGMQIQEVKLKTLYETILFPRGKVPPGVDFIIVRGRRSEPIFGQTIACSDVLGFEKRDLSRSYQDPTMTMGPRLARLLVNLCMTKAMGTILDPFCGLGTILQEAMMLRYNVVGVDISRSNVQRTRANLSWIVKTYDGTKKLRIEVKRGDSLQLSKEAIPAVQGIATEPILVPKYEENPDPITARESIESTRLLYTEFLKAARSILMDGSKMSIVSPAIIDKTGMEHRLSLSRAIEEAGFKNYVSSEKVEYPIRVESSKRRIVQRDIYVMVAN
jgi:tRNA G10  N-methylase Trm11